MTIAETLNSWNLSHTAGLGPATATAAIDIWLADFGRNAKWMTPSKLLEEIAHLTDFLLPFPTITAETFGKAMSVVLTNDRVNQLDEAQRKVKAFVLKHPRLGDPRLPINAAKWNAVSSEARQRLISWLAQDDLVFFFDFVIPDRKDPHDRKNFWLQYIDVVEDSHVALCSDDQRRLRLQSNNQFSYARIADSMDVSAFLMKFKGREEVVVVEFSKSGNAAYIHSAAVFAKTLGTLRQSEFRIGSERGLKHSSRLEKFIHKQPNEKWQREVRNFLAGMGIRLR